MFVCRQQWLQKVLFDTQLARATYSILTKRLEQQVQPHLEQLIKDLVCYSLDVNIPFQSNAAERRLFERVVEAIDYYCPVQPTMPIELVFLWLAQLNLLVGLSTDPDRTKNKSLSDNCGKSNGDMSDGVGDKELVTEEELMMEEKLETEEEIETKDLEGPEQLMSTQFDFFGKGNSGLSYGQAKTGNQLHWSQLGKTSLLHALLRLL